jgi:hypothetical protein
MNKYPINFRSKDDVPQDVWAAARDAVACGVPIETIARRAGIYKTWVEERAAAEDWLTQEKRDRILQMYEQDRPDKVTEIVEDLALASAAVGSDRALIHRSRIASLANQKLLESERIIQAPKTWKDLQILDNMARKAFGLDEDAKPAAMIQLNLLNTGATVEDA